MAIVTVQVGQCGNQLGEQFFTTLMQDIHSVPAKNKTKKDVSYEDSAIQNFFSTNSNGTVEARAVLFDMENKVVKKVKSNALKTKLWQYSNGCEFVGTKGSGNNWAHGYCISGPSCSDDILDVIQSQVEKCDSLSGFLIPMSLAGGTGSGLGSYITEKLREIYPESHIINQVICPSLSGEVVMQDYNAVLTLSHIYPHSNMVILQDNSELLHICQNKFNIKKPTLMNFNEVACHSFCSVVQPCQNQENSLSLGKIASEVCPVPSLKLVTLSSAPQESAEAEKFSTHTWESLMKCLKSSLTSKVILYDTEHKNGYLSPKSVSNLLVLRGFNQNCSMKPKTEPFYSSTFSSSPHLSVWSQKRPYLNHEKLATLVSNNQVPIYRLNGMTQKSWNMFNCKAYLHQYEKYSFTQSEFTNVFITMEQIIHDYKAL